MGRAQPWPVLLMAKAAQYGTTVSRSVSAKRRLADLPPSSNRTGLRLWAAVAMMRRAVAGPPVKEILSTPGCATSASPASPSPVTTLITPSGIPASRARSAKSRAENGVDSAGLMTTVLLTASEGGTFIARDRAGEFQVMMWPMTP